MDEINYVRNNLELTDAEVAEEIGRTAAAVQLMRGRHEIRKNVKVGYEEIQLLRNNPNISRKEFVELTGRSKNSYYYLKKLCNMEQEAMENFTELVKRMRETQKTAFFKSKFEPDRMEWIRKAHDYEKQVDAYLERMEE